MNVLGWILAVFGAAGIVFGLRMMLRGKKFGTVPFRTPSDIARMGPQSADAKGFVSTEGQVQLGPTPLVGPMSGETCIAYETSVERKWEKVVQKETGESKEKGSEKLYSEYRGAVFQLSDATGAVLVDTSQMPESPFEEAHKSNIPVRGVLPGTLSFGRFAMNRPAFADNEAVTTEFVGIEKALRPSSTMFALGQLKAGPQGLVITTPEGMLSGKLVLSKEGREKLIGKTRKHMILGYSIGGVLLVVGTVIGLTASPVESTSCARSFTDTVSCNDRMFQENGVDYAWTVATPGTYAVTVRQPPNLKRPIDAVVTVFDASGKQIAFNDDAPRDSGLPPTDARLTLAATAGSYKINVRDFAHRTIKGGYSFALAVEPTPASPSAASSAVAAPPPAAATTTAPAATGSTTSPADRPKTASPRPAAAPQPRPAKK